MGLVCLAEGEERWTHKNPAILCSMQLFDKRCGYPHQKSDGLMLYAAFHSTHDARYIQFFRHQYTHKMEIDINKLSLK